MKQPAGMAHDSLQAVEGWGSRQAARHGKKACHTVEPMPCRGAGRNCKGSETQNNTNG